MKQRGPRFPVRTARKAPPPRVTTPLTPAQLTAAGEVKAGNRQDGGRVIATVLHHFRAEGPDGAVAHVNTCIDAINRLGGQLVDDHGTMAVLAAFARVIAFQADGFRQQLEEAGEKDEAARVVEDIINLPRLMYAQLSAEQQLNEATKAVLAEHAKQVEQAEQVDEVVLDLSEGDDDAS